MGVFSEFFLGRLDSSETPEPDDFPCCAVEHEIGEPEPADDVKAAPLHGDTAAKMISELHAEGLARGYERVRIDRGTHPLSGDHYEIGYSYGEVAVRFSHLPVNLLFRRDHPANAGYFARALVDNARLAYAEVAA